MQTKKESHLKLNMPYLGIFRLIFKKTMIIYEINTLNLSTRKGQICKNKNWNFKKIKNKIWDQICNILLSFRMQFKKVIVIFEINTLEFVSNQFSANAFDFVIGSAFSKIPRSVFSEGPGPGQSPDLLYKVCLVRILFSECSSLIHHIVLVVRTVLFESE